MNEITTEERLRIVEELNRTANDSLGGESLWRALARITGINGYMLSCGHQAVGFEKPRYCPECGEEVGE